MTLGRVAVAARRHSNTVDKQARSSFSSSGDKQARSSFTSSGEKQQPRASFASIERHLSSSSLVQMAASPTMHQQQQPNHHQQQPRSSICSRVSSLTRDSSLRSLDPLKIEISDLTRLFGRTREQELLQTAFVRILKQDSQKTEIVVIHGKPGTGKTALVLDFKDAVTSTGTGYFCSGKFHQYQAVAAPYSVIIQAFNDLCEAVSAGPNRDVRRRTLYSSIGLDQLEELSKLLPKLKALLMGSSSQLYADDENDDDGEKQEEKEGTQEDSPHPWTDNVHKLHSIFQAFLRALCDPSHPVVMFLDDLQWADAASLDFMSSLIGNMDSRNFMLIGAYRDDISCDLPWRRSGYGVDRKISSTSIELENLTLENVDAILSDLTGSSNVTDLAKIVSEKTGGNPASIFEFLEMLQRKELLVFSFHTHRWVWDLELIKSKTEVTQNVGHSLVQNIDRLSKDGKTILSLAAVIGFSFDPKILEQLSMHLELLDAEYRKHMSTAMEGVIRDAVSGGLIHPDQMQQVMASQMEFVEDGSDASLRKSFYEETIFSVIQEAEVEGLIGKGASRSRYKFSHDLVHRSFYDNIPAGEEREKLHLRIGKVMKAFYQVREEDEILFAAVDHMNRGSAHLESDLERIDLIQLNKKASEQAKAKSALFSAADFSKKAIELLKVELDWNNHYDLLLNIYSEAAELNFACGRFDLSLRRCAEIHRNGRTLTDKLRGSYVRIEILHAQRKFKEAIHSCLTILGQLGEAFNPRPTKGHVLVEFRQTRKLVNKLTDDAIISLPLMVDPLQVHRMCFLSLLATLTFHATDEYLLPMVTLRMVKNSIHNGVSNYTPFAIAGYGLLLTVTGSAKEAFNYGSLAMTLCKRLKSDVCIPGTHLVVFSFLDHLRNPLLNAVEPLLKGYQAGISSGEVQSAAICMAASAAIGFHCALPLKTYAADLKNVCEQLKLLKQDIVWSLVAPFRHCALNLAGEATVDQKLSYGEVFDEKKFLNSTGMPESDKGLPWHNFFMISYIVAYIFNDFELAHETRKEMKKRNNGGPTGLHFLVYLEGFFSGLLDFARYRKSRKWKYLRRAKKVIKTMEKYVTDGMVNCHGMLLLLRAELESFGRHEDSTKKLYDDAMKIFAAGGFLHFQAIAHERAAEYMSKVGKRYWFETYIRGATRIYSDWGAVAKVQQLEEEHKLSPKLVDDREAPPVITIHGDESRLFTPIEGHIEEEHVSSDVAT